MEIDSSKHENNKYVSERIVNHRKPHESYEENASFFSKILFLWLNPLLSLGHKRALNPDDLPQLSSKWIMNMRYSSCDRSNNIYSTVSQHWNASKDASFVSFVAFYE